MTWAKAIFWKDVEAVKTLIAAGEKLNDVAAAGGFTPLLYAALMGNPEIVRMLIQAGADPNARTSTGESVTMVARRSDIKHETKEQIIRMLLGAGAPPEPVAPTKNSSVERSTAKSITERTQELTKEDIELGKSLVTRIREAIQAERNLGEFLILAETLNDATALKILFDQGVGVRSILASFPLDRGNEKMVEYFLENGADVNAQGFQERTPIFNTDSTEIMRLLLNAGANVNVKDEAGMTPLMHAASRKICEMLLSAGADIHATDEEGRSALMWLAEGQGMELVIEAGGVLDAIDNEGKTALIHHTINNDIGAVRHLIRAKADLNIKDNSGKTALRYALVDGRREIADLLKKSGASTKGVILDAGIKHWKLILKLSIVSIISVLLVLWIFSWWTKPAPEKRRVDVGGSVLTMRAEPNLKGTFILSIPDQAKVVVIKEDAHTETIAKKTGKWTKVSYKGEEGWVFGGFLSKE